MKLPARALSPIVQIIQIVDNFLIIFSLTMNLTLLGLFLIIYNFGFYSTIFY